MQLKNRWTLCLFSTLAGCLLAAFAGCGRPSLPANDTPTLPFEGQTVKIVSPGEPITTLLNRYARSWERQVGARHEVVSRPDSGNLPTVADSSIWIVRPAEMPRWAAAGQLAPLPAQYRATGDEYG